MSDQADRIETILLRVEANQADLDSAINRVGLVLDSMEERIIRLEKCERRMGSLIAQLEQASAERYD